MMSNQGMKQGNDFNNLKCFINFKLACCEISHSDSIPNQGM